MKLKRFSKEELEQLYHVIRILSQTRNIFPSNPKHKEKVFEVQALSIFQHARSNDGMPSHLTNGMLQFNYKPWFEFLDDQGIIELEKNPIGFKNWKIKTDIPSLQEFEKEVLQTKIKPIPYDRCFAFESMMRDIINNEVGKVFPLYPDQSFTIPNLIFRNETIDGLECDAVGRNMKDNQIRMFIEITKGAIDDKYLRKQKERRDMEENALLWFIGSRINETMYQKLIKDKKTIISLIPSFIEKYPILTIV